MMLQLKEQATMFPRTEFIRSTDAITVRMLHTSISQRQPIIGRWMVNLNCKIKILLLACARKDRQCRGKAFFRRHSLFLPQTSDQMNATVTATQR